MFSLYHAMVHYVIALFKMGALIKITQNVNNLNSIYRYFSIRKARNLFSGLNRIDPKNRTLVVLFIYFFFQNCSIVKLETML